MKKILGFIGCFAAFAGFAQTAAVDSTKAEETLETGGPVITVMDYKPTIADANKLGTAVPVIETPDIKKPEIKYTSIKKQVPTHFEIAPIKAAKMRGEPLTKLDRGYVKMGFGNYVNSLGELYLSNSRSRKYSLGFRAKHLGSNGQINNVGNTQFSDNSVDLFGKRYFRRHMLKGGIRYDRNVWNYYGYDPNEFNNLRLINGQGADGDQVINKLSATVSFGSVYKDSSKVNYDNKMDYYHLFDAYSGREMNVAYTGGVSRYFGKEKWLVDYGIDYNNYLPGAFKSDSAFAVSSNAIVRLNPKLKAEGKKWKLVLGLATHIDANETAQFHFYPDADVQYRIVSDMLIAFAGAGGGLQRNGYLNMITENPYIELPTTLRNINNKLELYGGLRGVFSSEVSFELQYNRKRVENMMFHINSGVNLFTPLFADATVEDISGELTVHKSKKLDVVGRADYYLYQVDSLFRPWQLPTFKGSLVARYSLKKKLVFTFNTFFMTGREAYSTDSTAGEHIAYNTIYAEPMAAYVDVNMGVEYRANKRFGAFLNFNNLLAAQYERWNKYPTQRFNVMFGLKYSFWKE